MRMNGRGWMDQEGRTRMVECCILIPQYALIVQWCGLNGWLADQRGAGVEKVDREDQVDWFDDVEKDKEKVNEVDKVDKDMLDKDQVYNLTGQG